MKRSPGPFSACNNIQHCMKTSACLKTLTSLKTAVVFTLLIASSLPLLETAAAQDVQRVPDVSEEIQKRREEMEREKAEYLLRKAKVDDINARVQRYRDLRDSVPFLTIPGTTNIVRLYVNNHDIKEISRELYFLTDGATPEGFEKGYWSTVLWLNQADQYRYGVPEYGLMDAEDPDENLVILPNIRKSGLKAVVASLSSNDSTLAVQFTTHALLAYRRRLKEEVERLVLLVGEPRDISGPAELDGEPQFALFANVFGETRETLSPRKLDESSIFINVEREDVVIDRVAILEPLPAAFALREGINMLGRDYQGYNVQYVPGNVVFSPEGGPMAFFGGRTPSGKARTQPGLYFSFNQKVKKYFLLNQTAFAAFGMDDAPAVNGGILNAGIDLDLGYFSVSGLVGFAAFNVVAETSTGSAFTFKLGIPAGERLHVGGIWMITNISDTIGISKTGIQDAGFVGLNLSIR